MTAPHTPPCTYPAPASTSNADFPVKSPQASANSESQTQHSSSTAQNLLGATSDCGGISNKHLWVLPLTSLLEDQRAGLAHQSGSGLLRHVLTSNGSTVCFNVQGQHSTSS